MDPELKQHFNQVFVNVPLAERRNPIYVDEEYGPMSWLVAKLEVDADTKIGQEIALFLARAKII